MYYMEPLTYDISEWSDSTGLLDRIRTAVRGVSWRIMPPAPLVAKGALAGPGPLTNDEFDALARRLRAFAPATDCGQTELVAQALEAVAARRREAAAPRTLIQTVTLRVSEFMRI